MPEQYKEWAQSSAARILNSLFSTTAERAETTEAASAIEQSITREEAQDHLALMKRMLDAVMARESGTAGLSLEKRREVREGLDALENRLAQEIRERKASQRRDLLVLLALLAICIAGTTAGSLFLAINGAGSAENAVGAAVGLAAGVACVVILARMMQNTREATERLDEKLVAVRFLRMALHSNWETDTGVQLIGPAIGMFIQHFTPASAPLGPEDTAALLEGMRQ